jgi:hypothetical protein
VFDGGRKWLQRSAPAPLAKFIGVNEIIRGLAAFRALDRYRSCYAAHRQATSKRLTLDPLAEYARAVSFAKLVVGSG